MSEREVEYIENDRKEFRAAVKMASDHLEAIADAVRQDFPVDFKVSLGSYEDLKVVRRRDDLHEKVAMRVQIGSMDLYYPLDTQQRKYTMAQGLALQSVIALANSLEAWDKKTRYGDPDIPF